MQLMYEEGGLVPPTTSTQKKERELSSSYFNFLRRLNPLNEDDFHLIECCLHEWRTSGVRPESAVTKVTNLNEEGEESTPLPHYQGNDVNPKNERFVR